MCYRKLANCFGRVTAGVDIHTASNVLAMVLPLCLQRSEGDGTCLPPLGWNLDDCQGPECWLEGHAPLGLPYSAAWHHIVTLRIRRSSLIMPKPLMRSHCKAMCYRKLVNGFGRVTEGVDIKAASNVLAMVLPLFATLGKRWHLPPACWLKSSRLPRPRVLILGVASCHI